MILKSQITIIDSRRHGKLAAWTTAAHHVEKPPKKTLVNKNADQ